MEPNILTYYGLLTREEYEAHCFRILPARMQMAQEDGWTVSRGVEWAVQDVDKVYPKTLAGTKVELRQRGLDPGDEEYGLARVVEAGDVIPVNGLWDQDDIDIAMISLAELNCIEPWIHTCQWFNVRPADYVKARRIVAEQNVDHLGQMADEPLFYRYEFAFGNNLIVPGSVTITLRDDWERILRQINERDTDVAEKD